MKSYHPKHDWTAKSRKARRLFKELDELEGRENRSLRKHMRRQAKAAKAEAEFLLSGYVNSAQYREMWNDY